MSNAPGRLEGAQRFEQPDHGRQVSRRLFTLSALSAAAGLALPAQAEERVRSERINAWLANIRDMELPGNPRVRLRLDDRAQHGLVIIENCHADDELTADTQKEVRGILLALMRDRQVRVREVFKESQLSEDQDLTGVVISRPQPEKDMNRLARTDAVELLRRTHDLKVRGGELLAPFMNAHTAIRHDWKDKNKYIFDMRDLGLMEVVSGGGRERNVAVWGKLHTFDNLALWNRRKPDAAFSMAFITPPSLEGKFMDKEKLQPGDLGEKVTQAH